MGVVTALAAAEEANARSADSDEAQRMSRFMGHDAAKHIAQDVDRAKDSDLSAGSILRLALVLAMQQSAQRFRLVL